VEIGWNVQGDEKRKVRFKKRERERGTTEIANRRKQNRPVGID